MCQFLETIKIENRILQHPDYHQQRMNRTMEVFYPTSKIPVLEQHIHIPDWLDNEMYKCRVIYSQTIRAVEFELYSPRPINTLKVVHDDTIDYSFKFSDRSQIQHLLSLKEKCDDVLIVKNGQITDTSYCNILFFDGNRWVTPANPLLPGTCRRRLLDNLQISTQAIKITDLHYFNKFMLINAMLDFDEKRSVDISRIIL